MMYPSPVDREKLEEFSKTDAIGNGGSLGQGENLCFMPFVDLMTSFFKLYRDSVCCVVIIRQLVRIIVSLNKER